LLTFLKERVRELLKGPVNLLHKIGFTPNIMTFLGLISATLSGILYAIHQSPVLAASFYIISGLFDILDGALAHRFNMATPFGEILDSVTDRYGDGIVLFGVMYGGLCDVWWGIGAILGSVFVSYVRAKGESLGLKMSSVGIAERAERILIICIASYLEVIVKGAMYYSIIILTILTHFTVLQRAYHLWKNVSN
jgi:archaetidylinositol phosphate synthase